MSPTFSSTIWHWRRRAHNTNKNEDRPMGVTESLGVSQWFRCLFTMVSLPPKLTEARCGTWNSVSPHGATLRAIGSPRPFIPLILQPPVQLFKSTMRVPPLVPHWLPTGSHAPIHPLDITNLSSVVQLNNLRPAPLKRHKSAK